MWGFVLLFFLLPVISGCKPKAGNQAAVNEVKLEENKPDSMPVITFDHTFADLGKMTMGEKAGIDFTFTNTGSRDLLILSAKASCGCTVPEWEKRPIPAGQAGRIRVVFDSSGALGMQNKSIRILTNARNAETDIMISAQVAE